MRCLTQHGVVLVVVLMSLIASDVSAVAQWAEPANVLACRLANYREFQDAAWTVFESSRRGGRYLMYDLNAFSKAYWDREVVRLGNSPG